jgi:hypothetical protein
MESTKAKLSKEAMEQKMAEGGISHQRILTLQKESLLITNSSKRQKRSKSGRL